MQISHAALRSSQLALADGVPGKPSLRFRLEPSSGLRRVGNGQVGIDVLGVTRLIANTTGVTIGDLTTNSLLVGSAGALFTGQASFSGGVRGTSGPLAITNGATIAGPLGVTGATNAATFAGPVNANNGLTATGPSSFSSTLQVGDKLTVSGGGADITGAVTLRSGLTLSGATGVTGDLTVTGNTIVTGVLTLGPATGAAQLRVPASYLGILDGSASQARPLKAASVTASTNYANDAGTNNIWAAGSITAQLDMAVGRNMSVTGNFSASGQVGGNSLSISPNGGTINGNLTVNGAVTHNGNGSIFNNGLTVKASINIQDSGLDVIGGIRMSSGSLTVPAGNISAGGSISASGGFAAPGGNNDFAGNLIVRNGINITIGGLTVGGTYTTNLTGPVTVGVGLTVHGSINLADGGLTVGGNYQTHLTGPLVADSTASVASNLSVSGNLTCYAQNYGQTVYANAGLTVAAGGSTIWGNTSLQGDNFLGGHTSINNVITGTVPNGANVGDPNVTFYAVYAAVGNIQPSKRSLKEQIEALDATAALDAVLATPIYRFRYIRWPSGRPPVDRTRQAAGEPNPLVPIRTVDEDDGPLQVGFMSDEAHPLLLFGTDSVTAQSTASVALAAIQALAARLLILEQGVPR